MDFLDAGAGEGDVFAAWSDGAGVGHWGDGVVGEGCGGGGLLGGRVSLWFVDYTSRVGVDWVGLGW